MARGATRRNAKADRPLPGWAWLLAGLAIGLFAALIVWLNGERRTASAVSPEPKPPVEKPAEVKPPKVIEAPPPGRSRYDFYTLLPELEVVVPDAGTGGNAPKPRQVEEPGEYILQAGSFRNFADADRLKANLALLGIVANIQTVKVNDDTWHRVRIGPYRDLAELNRLRDRLHENKVQTMLMKVQG